jgi:hypothetical protein
MKITIFERVFECFNIKDHLDIEYLSVVEGMSINIFIFVYIEIEKALSSKPNEKLLIK